MIAKIVIPKGWKRLKNGAPLKPSDRMFSFEWDKMKPPHWELVEVEGCKATPEQPYIRRAQPRRHAGKGKFEKVGQAKSLPKANRASHSKSPETS